MSYDVLPLSVWLSFFASHSSSQTIISLFVFGRKRISLGVCETALAPVGLLL